VTSIPRILIVEDDQLDQYLIKRAFDQCDHGGEYAFASDAEDALAQLQAGPLPQLIVTDLRMPGIGGFGLLRELKSDQKLKNIPAIVFSTSSQEEDIREAYDRHANSYVVKPTDSAGYERFAFRVREYWLFENKVA